MEGVGQGVRPSVAPLHPNMGQMPPSPPPDFSLVVNNLKHINTNFTFMANGLFVCLFFTCSTLKREQLTNMKKGH